MKAFILHLRTDLVPMRLPVLALVAAMLLATGCGPSAEVTAVEAKAKALIARRASAGEAAADFGRAPYHIYTRAEVLGYLKGVAPDDTSVRRILTALAEFPEAHSLPLPGGEIFILFDEAGQASGYYSNIQL